MFLKLTVPLPEERARQCETL